MTYNAKAVIIEIILLVVSGIITIGLSVFFESKGYKKMLPACGFIPTTAFGFYILFGKYVYLRGPVTKRTRIIYGLLFLFMMPVVWFVMTFSSN